MDKPPERERSFWRFIRPQGGQGEAVDFERGIGISVGRLREDGEERTKLRFAAGE